VFFCDVFSYAAIFIIYFLGMRKTKNKVSHLMKRTYYSPFSIFKFNCIFPVYVFLLIIGKTKISAQYFLTASSYDGS